MVKPRVSRFFEIIEREEKPHNILGYAWFNTNIICGFLLFEYTNYHEKNKR